MTKEMLRAMLLAAALLLALVIAAPAYADEEWDPQDWADEDTLELLTQAPGDEPHWSIVWLVVIEDQLYVRLGNRAAERFQMSVTNPYLAVKIDDEEFARVKGVAVPEQVAAIDGAMKEKYWSDWFASLLAHPLYLRLEPAS